MVTNKKIICFGLAGAIGMVSFIGCGLLDSGDKHTVSLNVIVSSTSTSNAVLSKMSKNVSDNVGFNTIGQKISFTPTSIKVTINSISIFQEWADNGTGEIVGGGDKPQISITFEKEFDLISDKQLNELYNMTTNVDSSRFGKYIGALVLLKDTVSVSGSVLVNGKTYLISDKKIQIGFSGQHYAFGDTLIVNDSIFNPTLRLMFDTENMALLQYTDNESSAYSPHIEDSVALFVPNAIIIPYVGIDLPSIEKYKLTVDGDETYSLKVILLANTAGTLTAAAIQPVFYAGFGNSGYNASVIDPGRWNMPTIILSSDNSFTIERNITYDKDTGISDRYVTFPAFYRTHHSGALILGYPTNTGTQRLYSAIQYEVTSD